MTTRAAVTRPSAAGRTALMGDPERHPRLVLRRGPHLRPSTTRSPLARAAGRRRGRPARRRRRIDAPGRDAGRGRRGARARRPRARDALRRETEVPLSVDTTKAAVAAAALAAGADIVNDVCAGRIDPAMLRAASPSAACPSCSCTCRARRPRCSARRRYDDVVARGRATSSRQRAAAARAAGIAGDAHRARPRHRLRQAARAQPGAARAPRRAGRARRIRSWSGRRGRRFSAPLDGGRRPTSAWRPRWPRRRWRRPRRARRPRPRRRRHAARARRRRCRAASGTRGAASMSAASTTSAGRTASTS